MTHDKRIEKREARLLRWESYIRRTRHVAFWLGILVIALPIILQAAGIQTSGDNEEASLIGTGLFFLLWAYTTNLQVRHIESIKYHQSIKAGSSVT